MGDAVGEDVGSRVAVNVNVGVNVRVKVGGGVWVSVAVMVRLELGEGGSSGARVGSAGVTSVDIGAIAKETWQPVTPTPNTASKRRNTIRRNMRGNLT